MTKQARIIAVANHKGGVGKTTSVASIGAALCSMGRKVLLVDLDAQANLTTSLYADEPTATIYEALKGEAEALPVVEVKDGLNLVCSDLGMAGVELDLASRTCREYVLKDLLEPLQANYDYILLDCPPSLGLVTINAFVAATDLFIPLTAEALPSKGIKMLTDVLAMVRKRLNPTLALSGVMITRYKRTKLSQVVEDSLRATFGENLFNTRIRENVAVAEAPLFSQSIVDYLPQSNGAQDYKALTAEVVSRFEK